MEKELKDFFFQKNVSRYLEYRAMAMCFALMFGRLGSVTGSSLTAILLDKYCQGAFYTPAISLIGKPISSANLISVS